MLNLRKFARFPWLLRWFMFSSNRRVKLVNNVYLFVSSNYIVLIINIEFLENKESPCVNHNAFNENKIHWWCLLCFSLSPMKHGMGVNIVNSFIIFRANKTTLCCFFFVRDKQNKSDIVFFFVCFFYREETRYFNSLTQLNSLPPQ